MQALWHIFSHPSPKCRAQRPWLSLWLPRSSPKAKFHQTKRCKKRLLNARRTQKDTSSETLNGAEKSTWSAGDDTVLPDEVMVRHLQIIVTLIEEREVKVDAVLVLADELLRQHRMEKRKKVFYVQGNLRSNPP